MINADHYFHLTTAHRGDHPIPPTQIDFTSFFCRAYDKLYVLGSFFRDQIRDNVENILRNINEI
jgi:hypothetical protein